jgi:hypothetical protein
MLYIEMSLPVKKLESDVNAKSKKNEFHSDTSNKSFSDLEDQIEITHEVKQIEGTNEEKQIEGTNEEKQIEGTNEEKQIEGTTEQNCGYRYATKA